MLEGSPNHGSVRSGIPGKILIVDDTAATLGGLVELLGSTGYQVVAAASFEEGKRLADVENPDLVIVDVRLGPYNGLQLAIREHLKHPDLPIIITSGFPDEVLEREARRYGAQFLAKPIPPADLIQLVRQLLERREQSMREGGWES